METATGKVRYEFSGAGAFTWFSFFTCDGSAFVAARLFGEGVSLWPTDHRSGEGRAPPKPGPKIDDLFGTAMEGAASSRGHLAFALHDGRVDLRDEKGAALRLERPTGKGMTALAFTPSGQHLIALRSGKLFAWRLAQPPTKKAVSETSAR